MIIVLVIKGTRRSICQISSEIISFAVTDAGSSFGKLAFVCVEGDGTLGVIIFESFGFGEAEAEFGG